MAGKKKKKAQKESSSEKEINWPSEFVEAFVKEFLFNKKKPIWPPRLPQPKISDKDKFQNISDVVQVLGEARTGLTPAHGSMFRNRVVEFVIAQDWPSKPPAPQGLEEELTQVRLAEICDIVHRMIAAVNKEGGGGSGGELPPHHL